MYSTVYRNGFRIICYINLLLCRQIYRKFKDQQTDALDESGVQHKLLVNTLINELTISFRKKVCPQFIDCVFSGTIKAITIQSLQNSYPTETFVHAGFFLKCCLEDHKTWCRASALTFLPRYAYEMGKVMQCTVTGDETWISYAIL